MSDQEQVFKHIDEIVERVTQEMKNKQNGNPLTIEQQEKLLKLKEDLRAEILQFFKRLNS